MRAILGTIFVLILANGVLGVPRAIPSTEENAEYFGTVEEVITKGERSVSPECPAGDDLQQLVQCISTCNSAGEVKRNNCCCVTSVSEGSLGIAHFGLAGGCRYRQQLQNYTNGDRMDYKSFPIDPNDSAQLYFDENSCESITEQTSSLEDSCQCSITWTVERSGLNNNSPLPTPSESATPERSVTPTVTPSPSFVSNSPSNSLEMQSPIASPMVSPDAGVPPPAVSPDSSATPVAPDASDDEESEADPSTDMEENETMEPDDDSDDDDSDSDGESGDDDSVCVDERYLTGRGFTSEHMVHKSSFLSPVWCPSHPDLPCATSNHKIRLNGVSISYKQMCEKHLLSCRRDVTRVNSVWTHVWQEVVHDNAVLTMYDVRYSESAQRLLHRFMHSVRVVVGRQ